MGFPDDMGLDDNDDSGDSLFPENERPTVNARNRRTEAVIKKNPEYAITRIMTAIVNMRQDNADMRRDIDRLNRSVFKRSIRPQVQTAGVSAGTAALMALIYQLLHSAGIIK